MSAIHAPTSAALKMANAPTTRRAGPGRRRSRRGPSAGGAGAAAPSSTGGRYRERRARRQGACTTDADTVTSQVGRRRRRPTFVIWATEGVGEVTNVGRYCSGVSFDLAVWEGARPATDEAAATEFQRLYGRWIEPLPVSPPTPAIRAYVDALLAHWPDI